MNYNLIRGDCLEKMKDIPDKSIDMILCDLPYGTTACSWDTIIPFDRLWVQYKRIIKHNSAIILTASQPFTTALISSNYKMFKYCLVWHKTKSTGFQDVNYRPLKNHEDIVVFSNGGCSTGSKIPMQYNPQGLVVCNKPRTAKKAGGFFRSDCDAGGTQTFTNWPKSVISFKSESKTIHPTQKPVALMEYLIKTYTNENDLVLDNCMGSGSTGIAALNTNRNFIGIEMDENYFNIAKTRIESHYNEKLNTTSVLDFID